ncbi:putative uncharacterized protein DDB_G0271982 [Trichomycterus rosablanca]|uniref:putative uncharacterized protein DDB_G0271982 n=1 Tax=Trichomycterus rosablanca TaxID=2290929 RepID=UPI002F360876
MFQDLKREQIIRLVSSVGSDEDTKNLIRWRVVNQALFTGKQNAAVRGFEAFVLENQMQGTVTPTYVKKKWENLKQKYKELKCPPTGVSTEGGEATTASWKWYVDMDEAIGGRPSISPLTLISSSGQDAAIASPSSRSMETPANKRRREKDLVAYLREMEERENEREIEAAENEERRWREAEEREERRERERIEREEKTEQEARQREEKRERETREREERRDQEARMREERRAREARVREERFIKILEILMKK